MTLLSSSSLQGNSVHNRAGEELGSIEDFMLDVQTGNVRYAVLSFGGFLGLGDKLFAVPMQALTVDQEDECFILDVDKERLKDAPGFDKDDWPNMADHTFTRDVNAYYGVH